MQSSFASLSAPAKQSGVIEWVSHRAKTGSARSEAQLRGQRKPTAETCSASEREFEGVVLIKPSSSLSYLITNTITK